MNKYIKKYANLILFTSIMVILLFGTCQKFTQEDDCECPTFFDSLYDFLVSFYPSAEVTTGEPIEESTGEPIEVTTGEPEESSWYNLMEPLSTTEEDEPQPFEQSSFI